MDEFQRGKGAAGIAFLVMASALQEQLREQAKKYGNRSGRWLDAIQERYERDVKGIRSSGISEEEEFILMRSAIAMIGQMINDVRVELLPEKDL